MSSHYCFPKVAKHNLGVDRSNRSTVVSLHSQQCMGDAKLHHRQELSSESSIWDDKATEDFLDECISKLDALQTYLENSMTEEKRPTRTGQMTSSKAWKDRQWPQEQCGHSEQGDNHHPPPSLKEGGEPVMQKQLVVQQASQMPWPSCNDIPPGSIHTSQHPIPAHAQPWELPCPPCCDKITMKFLLSSYIKKRIKNKIIIDNPITTHTSCTTHAVTN